MLIKGRKCFDARGRVVNLVEDQPPALFVAYDMPPIEEESADNPAHKAFSQRYIPIREMEEGDIKQLNPEPGGGQRNYKLRAIHQENSQIPTLRWRQLSSGEQPFKDQECDCGADDENAWKSHSCTATVSAEAILIIPL